MRRPLTLLALSLTGPALAAAPAMPTGQYRPYSAPAFEAARGERRVLFFHATWCPTCQQLDRELTANPGRLPAGVVIFKTDYDREVALKTRYGVTYQHTFVLVDAQGRALEKWNGGSLKDVLAHLR